MFIFQWLRYSNVVIAFWLRNKQSIKYVNNWGNKGESSKMCTGAYKGKKKFEKSVIRYTCELNGWPRNNFVEYIL